MLFLFTTTYWLTKLKKASKNSSRWLEINLISEKWENRIIFWESKLHTLDVEGRIWIRQWTYIIELLNTFSIEKPKSVATPVGCKVYSWVMSGIAISWNSKKQSDVSLSIAEDEYIALSKASQESIWLGHFLMDIWQK